VKQVDFRGALKKSDTPGTDETTETTQVDEKKEEVVEPTTTTHVEEKKEGVVVPVVEHTPEEKVPAVEEKKEEVQPTPEKVPVIEEKKEEVSTDAPVENVVQVALEGHESQKEQLLE